VGRLDHKRGRFHSDFETNEIHDALEGHQRQVGDVVDYYRFNAETSEMNDIYDEGDGVGKTYDGPYRIPVIHVTREEGLNQDTDIGFYYNDDIHMTASYQQLVNSGLTRMDIEHHTYLKDRIVYDGRVFRVTRIEVLGQIQRRDLVVGIDLTQVKPDELVNDEQFADFASRNQ
jgi:hypothetical protein